MQQENFKEAIKLYNSQITSAEMVKTNFVIRLREFNKIWHDIEHSSMTHPEQHYIVQGVRGAGKTTLLRRLAIEIEEHKQLSQWLIPLTFKEEEYGITSLFTFWEKVAEILEEHSEQAFSKLVDELDELDSDDPKVLFKLINSYLNKQKKKVVLFIDNIVDIFELFTDQEESLLREILTTNSNFRIIGGSAVSLEHFFDNDAPFYQFFKLITLKGLTKKDTTAMLKSLAKHAGEKEQQILKDILKYSPGKIESIRRLTGGVPRTMSILFNVLMEGPQGTAFTLLEDTIDKATPLYKHRMDDLSKKQKPIVNAIALNWQAISVKELVEKTNIPSKILSAQLNQLEKQWVIEKIKTDTKNHLYAIKERFFNIWYLMRYGRRRDKNKVKWLTEFMEIWCTAEDLLLRAKLFREQLTDSCHPLATLTLANAYISSDKLPDEEKFQLREEAAKYLEMSGHNELTKDLLSVPSSDNKQGEYLKELWERFLTSPSSVNEAEKEELEGKLIKLNSSFGLWMFYKVTKNNEKSKQYILKAYKEVPDFEQLWINVLVYCVVERKDKRTALEVTEKICQKPIKRMHLLPVVLVFLWNNHFSQAEDYMNEFVKEIDTGIYEKNEQIFLLSTLLFFISKEQVNLVLNWSEQINKSLSMGIRALCTVYNSADKEKEINKLGSEMTEAVNNMLKSVETLKIEFN